MRIFKNKWFNHWARKENVSDAVLIEAAEEITKGEVEADLGGCLFKKRLAKIGTGKSGGYRVIVGYRKQNNERIIFLYAFAKNQRANISDKEKMTLRLIAKNFVAFTEEHLQELLKIGSIWEVKK